MKKAEELKRLKRELDETKYIAQSINGKDGFQTPYSIFYVRQNLDTLGAVENIEEYFESIIRYLFSKNDITYDGIALAPFFSLFFNIKDYDDNCNLTKDAKPLPYFANVRMNGFYCINKEDTHYFNPGYIHEKNFNQYFINLDEFIHLLEQDGFSYNGERTIEEIYECIKSRQPYNSKITLSLSKK